MGLNLALNTARSALAATATQIAVSSRNTAGANDPSYVRRIGVLVASGAGSTVLVQRASDAALYARTLTGASAAAGSAALLAGLQTLSRTIGDTGDATSPAARLGALNAALGAAANQPDDPELARAAVESARGLASGLNAAAGIVHTVRADADAALGASVTRINDLLGQFDIANTAVIRAGGTGADPSDALDDRDRILSSLSEEIGITTVTRPGNDLAIYTDGGVPLFDRGARQVSLGPTSAFNAGTKGAPVMVDGVPVTGAASPMPTHSGRIAGLADLRDTVAVRYEAQLDAMAGGLVDAFAETGTVPPATTPSTRAGLFTNGASTMTPQGSAFLQTGLAAAIRINAAVDPRRGGDLALLRDGGMNDSGSDTNFRANPAAAGTDAAYSARLSALTRALATERSFDPGTGIPGQNTLLAFSAASAGWLEGARKAAASEADYQATVLSRAAEAYSNASGVNVDDETARTLQLEQSYTASAKLLALVNDLLKTLMDVVR